MRLELETDEKPEPKQPPVYISDLTPKEKRALEREKLKELSFLRKIEYIWSYYKIIFAVLFAAGVLIYIGNVVYRNASEVELLSIAVVDGQTFDDAGLMAKFEQDVLGYLGSGNERETIRFDTKAMSGDGYTAYMKMAVVMTGSTTDVVFCDKDTYKEYKEDGAFKDWTEILGEDYSQYEPYLEDGDMVIRENAVWNSYALVSYEPVYIGVLVGSHRDENVKRLISFLLDR